MNAKGNGRSDGRVKKREEMQFVLRQLGTWPWSASGTKPVKAVRYCRSPFRCLLNVHRVFKWSAFDATVVPSNIPAKIIGSRRKDIPVPLSRLFFFFVFFPISICPLSCSFLPFFFLLRFGYMAQGLWNSPRLVSTDRKREKILLYKEPFKTAVMQHSHSLYEGRLKV